MAITVNTPVENQEIIDRFKDYLTNVANSGISYHTGNLPFSDFPSSTLGGGSGGKAAAVTTANIGGDSTPVDASSIYNALLTETNRYTGIRKMRARLFVEGGGGNTGSRPTPGYVADVTGVTYLNDTYKQNIPSVSDSSVASPQNIDASNLEGLLQNLKNAYNAKRDVTEDIVITVCHSSCHSSCHCARSRR